MGGGDLNAKKSWHPNTLKNQERVWKAEQAALEEKKRIAELQHERAQERDLAELSALARNRNSSTGTMPSDNRLQWMYDKPDKKAQTEEYLLGKTIDASFDRSTQSERDVIPAALKRPDPVDATGADVQVDIARKLREDPLILVKERERAARAALLNNPLQRRRLTELLRKEQEKRKEKKEKSKPKKDKNLDHMIADKLNALGGDDNINLAALLASDSSDDSSPKNKHKKKKLRKSSKEEKKLHKKSKKVKSNKKRHHSKHKQTADSYDELTPDISKKKPVLSQYYSTLGKHSHRHTELQYQESTKAVEKSTNKHKKYSDFHEPEPERKRTKHSSEKNKSEPDKHTSRGYKNVEEITSKPSTVKHKSKHKHYSDTDSTEDDSRKKSQQYAHENVKSTHVKERSLSHERKYSSHRYLSKSENTSKGSDVYKRKEGVRKKETATNSGSYRKGGSLTEAEKAARLAEMVRAGAEHELERGKRVAAQRATAEAEDTRLGHRKSGRSEACALPTSLESRLQSNRHYIQRDKRHMNEHFARR